MTTPPAPQPTIAAPTFALVRAPIAPMLMEPHVSAGQVSQALFGHAASLVESAEEWHVIRTLDGYEGWVHAGYLAFIEAPLPVEMSASVLRALDEADVEAAMPQRAHRGAHRANGGASVNVSFDPSRLVDLLGGDAVPRLSLGCTVRAGERKLRLPLGAWVHSAQHVLEGETVRLDEQPVHFPRDVDSILRTAPRWFEGTSYLWGGVTPWGADCSGLVQTVYGLHGVSLPRDAWMQATTGEDAGRDLDALLPGDLLFFSDREDRRISHVGMALGGGRMAHLALGRGGWSVETLSDVGDPYVKKLRERFLFARRVL